jgi:hypothetical protein
VTAVRPETHTSLAAQNEPRGLRALAITTWGLLLVQFLVGMLVNFYVQLPTAHPGTETASAPVRALQGWGWALTANQWALRLHMALGMLLGLSALLLVGLAIASRRRAWVIASLFGLLGLLMAGLNGVAFMDYSGRDENSFVMSFGFALALVAYGVGLYVTRYTALTRRTRRSGNDA